MCTILICIPINQTVILLGLCEVFIMQELSESHETLKDLNKHKGNHFLQCITESVNALPRGCHGSQMYKIPQKTFGKFMVH